MIHNIILYACRNDSCIVVGIDYKESEYAMYLNKYGILATNDDETMFVLQN